MMNLMSALEQKSDSGGVDAFDVPDEQCEPDDRYLLPISSGDLAVELRIHHSTFKGAKCRTVNTTDPTQETFVDFELTKTRNPNPAKLVCQDCPQLDHCLKYALENNEESGMWGGASGKERVKIKKEYKKMIEKPGAYGLFLPLGEFAVANRSVYIKPAKPGGATSSYRPPEAPTPDISEANCIGKMSRVFEELDTSAIDKLTKEKLGLAMIACRMCVFYGRCSKDPVNLPEDALPTVVGGQIRGYVPRRLVPSERYLRTLIPEVHQEEWRTLNQTLKNAS